MKSEHDIVNQLYDAHDRLKETGFVFSWRRHARLIHLHLHLPTGPGKSLTTQSLISERMVEDCKVDILGDAITRLHDVILRELANLV